MALIRCVECKKKISHLATTCPHCGTPHPGNGGGQMGTLKKVSNVAQTEIPLQKKLSKNFWIYTGIILILFLVGVVTTEPGSGSSSRSKRVSDADQTDWCYAVGTSLATVYLSNNSNLASEGVYASDVMKEGCTKQASVKGEECCKLCEDSFKYDIKESLK